MAQIIGLKEKQLMVKEINRKIKSLESVDEFLNTDNPEGVYTISFGETKTILKCKDKETINALVFAYKKDLIIEIRAQAEKYGIEFDENDEALLKINI